MKIMRLRWRPAALAVAACLSFAGTVHSAPPVLGQNLDSLLSYAREHHPELAALRFETDAAVARAEAADALPDPMLRTELSNFTNEGQSGGIELLPARVASTRYTISQSLPWPGKRDLRREVAEAGAEEARQRALASWRELARGIRQTYARHHVVSASLSYALENLDLLAQLEKIAQTRYANGIAAQQDVIKAQTERTALLGEVATLEGESEQLAARTRALIGSPSDISLQAPALLTVPARAARAERSTLEASVRERNPWLAAEDARIVAAEKSRELSYRNRYPDFTVGLTPMQMGSRVTSYDLMLEINIPLQQSRRRSEEREAERSLDAAKARREAALNQALAELGESLAALNAARRLDELIATRLLPQAELTLQSALAAYETGKVDFATVLDAQRQVRRAREDGVKARADQVMRLADIDRLTGEE